MPNSATGRVGTVELHFNGDLTKFSDLDHYHDDPDADFDTSSRVAPAASILTVDLNTIAANYRMLSDKVAPAVCAGVVKADAYGLGAGGASAVARGCRVFFVASLKRESRFAASWPKRRLRRLTDCCRARKLTIAEHRLFPTLNDLGQVGRWSAYCASHGDAPAVLHVDTGMSRLGLSVIERTRLETPDLISGFECRYRSATLPVRTPRIMRAEFAAENRVCVGCRPASSHVLLSRRHPEYSSARIGISVWCGPAWRSTAGRRRKVARTP